jgi:hypothetical protein
MRGGFRRRGRRRRKSRNDKLCWGLDCCMEATYAADAKLSTDGPLPNPKNLNRIG